MEQITVVELTEFVKYLAGAVAAISALLVGLKKILKKLFDEQMKAINARLDKLEADNKKTDLERSKDFLVSFLARAQWDTVSDAIEIQRFWEVFQHYVDNGGNSYIKEKVTKLKSEGKL